MAAYLRADRAIVKRQQQEAVHRQLFDAQLDDAKAGQRGRFEHRTDGVIAGNRVKTQRAAFEAKHAGLVEARRARLREFLAAEQKAFEQELADLELTPQQRVEQMAQRAYELKKRREDERQALVQEKLKQQLRDNLDELRPISQKVGEFKTIAARDLQLEERAAREADGKAEEQMYSQQCHEEYLKKTEREERDKAMQAERVKMQESALAVQLRSKAERTEADLAEEEASAERARKELVEQIEEDRKKAEEGFLKARDARRLADSYATVQLAQRDEERAREKELDVALLSSALAREREAAERDENKRAKAKASALAFMEAVKAEMASRAVGDMNLDRLFQEESERQWAKRYARWEKEEMARRGLLEEVYSGRAEQVRQKQQLREELQAEFGKDRALIEAEIREVEAEEREIDSAEQSAQRQYQQELRRQVDHHQVQAQRQTQQKAIEQRQAAIEAEKIRRTVEAEKKKAESVKKEVMEKHQAAQQAARSSSLVAPWAK